MVQYNIPLSFGAFSIRSVIRAQTKAFWSRSAVSCNRAGFETVVGRESYYARSYQTTSCLGSATYEETGGQKTPRAKICCGRLGVSQITTVCSNIGGSTSIAQIVIQVLWAVPGASACRSCRIQIIASAVQPYTPCHSCLTTQEGAPSE